tara:strand:- start:745 stop:1146 length:402 start_codon:yes stop_codon:yes gene_type:complete
MSYTVAIFGEAEKGEIAQLHPITSPAQLNDTLGSPPIGSEGISIAIRFLLSKKKVLFIRVSEEGFSLENYFRGLHLLEKERDLPRVTALCLPGVGDHVILDACDSFCHKHSALIISSQKDLFDYLTSRKRPSI